MKASKLIGVNLKNRRDETVGEVDDCLIDLRGQRIEFLIVSAGGFLGIGEHHAIMPFGAVNLGKDAEDGSLVATIDTTKERLKNAPAFDEEKWRRQVADADWRRTLENHYRVSHDPNRFSSRGADSFVMASELLDADVENAAGEDVAEVEDLAIELSGGYVAYAQLDMGGFLGIAEKSYAVPLNRISRVDGENPRFVTTLEKADLENAPTVARREEGTEDPESADFIISVHRFYHSEPPWSMRSDVDTASRSTEPVEIPLRIADREPQRFLVRVDTFTHVSGLRERETERNRSHGEEAGNDRGAADRGEESDRGASSRQGESDGDLRQRSGAVLGSAAARSVEAFGVELRGLGEADEGGKKIEVRITSAENLERAPASRGDESGDERSTPRGDERSTSHGSEKAWTFTASVDDAGRVSDVEVVSGQRAAERGASEERSTDRDSDSAASAGEDARPRHGEMSKEKATRLAAWLVGSGLHDRELRPGETIEAEQLSPDTRRHSPQGERRDSASAGRQPDAQDSSWTDCVSDVALKFEGGSTDRAVFSIVAARPSKIEPASARTGSRGLSSDRTDETGDRESRASNRDRDRSQGPEDDRSSAGQLRQSTTGGHDSNRLGTVVYSREDGLLDWMAVRLMASTHEHERGSHRDSASSKDASAGRQGDTDADTETRTGSKRSSSSTSGTRWDVQHARTGLRLTIQRV